MATAAFSFRPNSIASRRPYPLTRRARVESLEPRRMLATLVVDDDFAVDTATQFTTIQAAVDAAAVGDTVRVRKGFYEESVDIIDKRLNIVGDRGAVVDVDALGQYGFNIQGALSSGTKIQGLTIQDFDNNGTDTAANNSTVGVITSSDGSGWQILDNTIQNLTFGIYLNSVETGATRSLVKGNKILANNQGFGVEASSGNGIYSDQGLNNAVIEKNTFAGNQNAAITLAGGGIDTDADAVPDTADPTTAQSNIAIKENRITDSGIFAINLTQSKIESNKIIDSFFSGLSLEGGITFVTIKDNTIENARATGINLIGGFGNVSPSGDATGVGIGGNTNNTIERNKIEDAVDNGIALRNGSNNNVVKRNDLDGNGNSDLAVFGDAVDQFFNNGILISESTGNTVNENETEGSARDGIFLFDADSNTIGQNKSKKNGFDGIHANSDSTGNTFNRNLADLNGRSSPIVGYGTTLFDLHDESVGAGTAGTDNTWTNNKGRKRSPLGIGTNP